MLRLVVLDPGGTCGLLHCVTEHQPHPDIPDIQLVATSKVALDALPARLYSDLVGLHQDYMVGDKTLLVYESYHLRASHAKQQARKGSSHMPAAEGIGVFKGVAHARGFSPPIGIAPGVKEAGEKWGAKMLPGIADARSKARNDHERDVCDLAAYVLQQRSLGKAPFA